VPYRVQINPQMLSPAMRQPACDIDAFGHTSQTS
jgi:hypothetical protein